MFWIIENHTVQKIGQTSCSLLKSFFHFKLYDQQKKPRRAFNEIDI